VTSRLITSEAMSLGVILLDTGATRGGDLADITLAAALFMTGWLDGQFEIVDRNEPTPLFGRAGVALPNNLGGAVSKPSSWRCIPQRPRQTYDAACQSRFPSLRIAGIEPRPFLYHWAKASTAADSFDRCPAQAMKIRNHSSGRTSSEKTALPHLPVEFL
jgi:hypothetical protein